MNRRNFIRGTVLVTAAVAAGRVIPGEYDAESAEGLNRLTNREDPSALEQKHVPAVAAPEEVSPESWFDVNVNVGFMKEHPSTPGHWITWIKLLVDGNEVAKTSFEAGGVSASSAHFRIRLDKTSTLEAVEHCNLHGTWISDPVMIKVS